MRPEKNAMAAQYRQEVSDAVFVLLTDYRGLNVAQAEDLRTKLDDVDAHLRVVQNRIFKHVAEEFSYNGFEASLSGPTAMVVGNGDVVEVAKVLKAFIKENELPVIKIGALEGVILSADEIKQLADLPPRETLLGLLVGTLAAPMTQLVGVMTQAKSSLVYVLKAIEEKKTANG
jgi:large subunit ribosomal protein L10